MKKNSIYNALTNPYVLLIFLFVVFLFNSLNPLISYDENLWSYVGRIWNRNNIPPYIGAVENKTPGVFFLFVISDYFFQGSIFFVRTIGVFATLLSAFLLYKICTRLHSKLAGVFCMLVFGLSMCWLLLDGSYFAHTEVFMVLFSVISFYFIEKSKDLNKIVQYMFLGGIFIGIGISFKQIALTTVFGLILFFLVYSADGFKLKNKIKGVFLFFLGCITSISILQLILYFSGVSFSDYFEGAWLILLNSGSKATFKTHVYNLWKALIASRFIIYYLFILLFWFQKKSIPKILFWGLILWFVFDFIGVNASGYYYGHQIKQVMPSLSIITGIVISNLIKRNFYFKRLNTKPIFYIFLIVVLWFPYRQTYRTVKFLIKSPYSPSKEIGYWVRDNTNENDYVYILGADEKLISTLFWSDRVSSSKYFNSIFINEEKHRNVIYSDLIKKTPKIILKSKNDSSYIHQVYGSKIEDFIESNYTFNKNDSGIEIFYLNIK